MSALEGYLDHVSEAGVMGWARDAEDQARRVLVAIWTDKVSPIYVRASDYRPDLEHVGMGDGRYGFSARLDMTGSERLYVRVIGAAEDLVGSPVELGLTRSLNGTSRDIHRQVLGIAAAGVVGRMLRKA